MSDDGAGHRHIGQLQHERHSGAAFGPCRCARAAAGAIVGAGVDPNSAAGNFSRQAISKALRYRFHRRASKDPIERRTSAQELNVVR